MSVSHWSPTFSSATPKGRSAPKGLSKHLPSGFGRLLFAASAAGGAVAPVALQAAVFALPFALCRLLMLLVSLDAELSLLSLSDPEFAGGAGGSAGGGAFFGPFLGLLFARSSAPLSTATATGAPAAGAAALCFAGGGGLKPAFLITDILLVGRRRRKMRATGS